MSRWAEFDKIFRRARAVLAAIRTLSVRTDVARWRRVAREVPSWDQRNRIIAEFIKENSSVLDLGAGACLLKFYLKPGCTYQPCDIIVSSTDVIYCDFNSAVYPILPRKFDYVVCSGIFEYMRDPVSFLSIIRDYGHRIILSYNPTKQGELTISRLAKGWVNHLNEDDLNKVFANLKLRAEKLDAQQSNNQIILELVKTDATMS